MSASAKGGFWRRLAPFLAPAVEITVTLLLRPGGVPRFLAIGLAVALFALAFDLAGLDKKLLTGGRFACLRCRGVNDGLVVFTLTLIVIVAESWAPNAGSQNPGVPWVLFGAGAALIALIAQHGYRHRVKRLAVNEKMSWLTGFLNGYLAAFALTLGLLLLY
jgi:hypothetical protein